MLRIEILRKQLGLSQEEFAQKVNMTQQRISSYEKGKREPDLETIKQFSDFFDCSIDYLLGKSDIKNSEKLISNIFGTSSLKELQELTAEEISDALKIYKEMKKRVSTNRYKITIEINLLK